METFSTILDYLARGAYGQAADIAAQRLKALERHIYDNNWERAQWVELLEPPSAPLSLCAPGACAAQGQGEAPRRLREAAPKGV